MRILLFILALYIAYKLIRFVVGRRKAVTKEVDAYYLVEFDYLSSSDELTHRRVYVTSGKRGHLFKGFCMLRNDVRSFAFDRIVDDVVTDLVTGELMDVDVWKKEFQKGRDVSKQRFYIVDG